MQVNHQRSREPISQNLQQFQPLLILKVQEPVKHTLQDSIQPGVQGIGARTASLSHLWPILKEEIVSELDKPQPPQLELLFYHQQDKQWISATGNIVNGVLELIPKSQSLANREQISLHGANILGHLSKKLIQVCTSTGTLLLACADRITYVKVLASFYMWALTRGPGLKNKRWRPPVKKMLYENDDLLICDVEAIVVSESNLDNQWAPRSLRLQRSGKFTMFNNDSEELQLNLRDLSQRSIRRLSPTIVFSNLVVLVKPSIPGVDAIYLKFYTDDDFDDWFMSMQTFTKHVVYADASLDPLRSFRFLHRVKISSITLRCDDQNPVCLDKQLYTSLGFRHSVWTKTNASRWDGKYLKWTQEYELQDLDSLEHPLELVVRVADSPISAMDDEVLGAIEVRLRSESSNQWFPIMLDKTPAKVMIHMTVERLPILDASYYQDLRQRTNDPERDISTKLAALGPQNTAHLASLLCQIHLAENTQNSWISNLIDAELQALGSSENASYDTLFRGDTMLTRGVEKVFQIVGKTLLERTVGDLVNEMLKTGETFELDPARLDMNEDLEQNRARAIYYFTKLWASIRKFAFPKTMRHTCHHLARSIQQHLQADESVVWSSLSAILFLRFFCPALLDPSRFGLCDLEIGAKVRRSLMILAKLLQGFANRVRFGSKEEWLIFINPFISEQEPSLIKWYQRMVSSSHVNAPDRIPKEMPIQLFMRDELTNPYLFDMWSLYAALAKWGASQTFSLDWDSRVREFVLECKVVDNIAMDIVSMLREPDKLVSPRATKANVHLFFNRKVALFSNDPAILSSELTELERRKKNWISFLKN